MKTQTICSEGRFIASQPSKYQGDVSTIYFRSNPELQFMNFLDRSDLVEQWTSEHPGTVIEYEFDGQTHHYYPDFLVRFTTDKFNRKRNKLEAVREGTCLIELKPKSNFDPNHPHANEHEVAVNQAKFEAATKFCKERGWSFRVMDISTDI